MAEGKIVTILLAGGTRSMEGAQILPGDSVAQVCRVAARALGQDEDARYRLLGQDGKPIAENVDVYKVVNDGDKLTLAPIETQG